MYHSHVRKTSRDTAAQIAMEKVQQGVFGRCDDNGRIRRVPERVFDREDRIQVSEAHRDHLDPSRDEQVTNLL